MSIAAGSLLLADAVTLLGAEAKAAWKIGICDWDLRATGSPGSFAVAKELGFEGVQVSYQTEGADSLANKENRPKFLAAAKEAGVGIASLCIGEMNGKPLATTPEAEGWVADCLDAMEEMNVDRVLIPFFSNADINEHKDQMPATIEKFKRLAPIAERKKKILAVESYLSAEDHLKLIDAVGSDALKVYYDVRNSWNKDYDIYREMELLGSKKLICEIHFKEDGVLLGAGQIDFPKVCATLEKVGFDGWVVVEGSTPRSSTPDGWKVSQTTNAQFVKKLLGR